MKKETRAGRKSIRFFLAFFALFALFSLTATVWAGTDSSPAKEDSPALAEMLAEAKANYDSAQASLSPSMAPVVSYGYYNAGTDVYFTSHTSGYAYTYNTGYMVPITAEFENPNLAPNLECYFGIWDMDLGDYVGLFYLGDLTTVREEGSAYVDTSTLDIGSVRYSVDAIIYDATLGVEDIDVYDSFDLNIKAISKPTISSAVSTGESSIKLSWKSLSGVSGYRVYKATSASGTYTYVGSTKSTYYNFTGLTTGKTYYFKVKAYCSGGETTKTSSYSDYKSCKPMPAVPVVTASSYSYNSVKLSWPKIPLTSSYQIYRATSATGSYSLVATVGASTYSWINKGLVTGKTYYYKVRSVHLELSGAKFYSNFCAYKAVKPVPSTPSVTASLATNNTGIKLTWKAISGASGYQIYRSTSATGTFSYLATASSTATSWTNTGLPNNSKYYYKVRAYHTEAGVKIYGAYSTVKSHDTLGAPVITANPGPDGTSAVIAWVNTKMYMSEYGFEVYRVNGDSTLTLLNGSDYGIDRYVDSGLAPLTTYTYKVRPFHYEGSTKIYGPYSNIASTTTSVVLLAPVLAKDGLVFDTSVTPSIPGAQIHWTPVENAAGYVIETYDLYEESAFHVLATVDAGTTTYTQWGIDLQGAYAYRVYAYYGTPGTSDYVHGMLSNEISFFASSYH